MKQQGAPPCCPQCFKVWDFVPDRSLPYSGALKAVHPIGKCVERVSVVADLPEPAPRKPQARIEYDRRRCDICRAFYIPRQHNQVCCTPECRAKRDDSRRRRKPDWFAELEQSFPARCKRHGINLTRENTHSRGRKQRICAKCNAEHQRAVRERRKARSPRRERTRIEVGKYAA
jgi:hypothetical protein